MTGFASPNHTQTPNEFFDTYMKDMGETELKVTLAIIRKTLGFHKTRDAISLSKLQEITGLSRQGAFDGAQFAIERGLIEIVGTGSRGVTIYGLVINYDQSTPLTSEGDDQSTNQTGTGLPSRHTKETSKKKKESKEKEIVATPFVSMKNSIQKAFEWDKPTDNEWGQIGKAASQLLKVDITPADVSLLYSYCKAQSGEKSFTPLFLTTKVSDWKKNRPPEVVPDKPLETYRHDLDDGLPATAEQIETAKATFAALVASKNANDKPTGVKTS